MGTRSITRIQDGKGREIVGMYRQMDGYPSGHGVELAEFLNGFQITNGLSISGNPEKTANGMNCLAAQIIAHFKTSPGSIYLYPPGSEDQEYIYIVGLDSRDGLTGRLTLKVKEEDSDHLLFSGHIDDKTAEALANL